MDLPSAKFKFIDVAAQMLRDPKVANQVQADVGAEAYREILERASNRLEATVGRDSLESYLTCDPLQGDLYHEFIVKGDESGVIDDWAIQLLGFGGIYYWIGGDFGVSGYFKSLPDALRVVREEFRTFLVSTKGRKYSDAFADPKAKRPERRASTPPSGTDEK